MEKTTIDDIKIKLNRNSTLYGLPKLINIHIHDSYMYTKRHMLHTIQSYFYKDPFLWEFPAKNYFVKLCISFYLQDKYDMNPYDTFKDSHIIPYKDLFIKKYSLRVLKCFDKEEYKKSYGYYKTMEIFGYLYD